MHELSIAQNLAQLACDAVRNHTPADELARVRVSEVHLRLGALAGVMPESLQFCYDVVTENTLLAGSRLVVTELPIVVFCVSCEREVELPGIQSLRCPDCGALCGDIRQGQELELASIHVLDGADALPG